MPKTGQVVSIVEDFELLSQKLPSVSAPEQAGLNDYRQGLDLFNKKRYKEAIASFQSARAVRWQIDFDKALCDYQIARCDYMLGHFREAARNMETVKVAARKDKFWIPSLNIDLGWAYMNARDYRSAEQTFKTERHQRYIAGIDTAPADQGYAAARQQLLNSPGLTPEKAGTAVPSP